MAVDPYRRAAKLYDAAFEPLNAPLRAKARRLYPPLAGWTVVDVGCGTGTALDEYRAEGCHVVGVDASEAMLSQARQRLGADADLRLASGQTLPVTDGEADLVHLCLVLHSVAQDQAERLLRDCARSLRTGGSVLVIDFAAGGARFPRGWATLALQWVAEAAAGPSHARHSWHFRRGGGIGPLAERSGMDVVAAKRVAGGTMQIALLRPIPRRG